MLFQTTVKGNVRREKWTTYILLRIQLYLPWQTELKKKKKGVSLYAWQRGFRIIVLVSILIILVRTFCKTHKKNYKLNKNQRQARILEAPLSNQQTQPVSMMCTLHRPFMPYSLWKKNEGIWFLWNLLWIWWVWRLVGIYLRKSNKAESCASRV